MAEGKIKKWFPDRGFGFIERNGLGDLFVHITQWKEPDKKEPFLGAIVSFKEGPGQKGKNEAKNVRLACTGAQASTAGQNTKNQVDDQGYRFLNPYNFVRCMEKERPKDSVLGDCSPPPHDRYVGMTGRITCTAKAETPIFISDSHKIKENDNGHRTYRFFEYDKEPALPSSSLRGMLRSVFEVVTNSCFAVFQKDEPYTLEHRRSRASNMVPARVLKLDENGAQFELLDCTAGPPISIPDGPSVVRAGSVLGSYPPQVLDRKTNQKFDQALSKLPKDAYDGMRVSALVTRTPVRHRSGRFRAFHAFQIVPANQHGSLKENHKYLKVFGWLHLTGPNIENKHDERLFFRWDDKDLEPPEIDKIPDSYLCKCNDTAIAEYNHHLNEYWERLGKTVEDLGNQRWPNSTNGIPQPSTFVIRNGMLKINDLVYVQRNSNGKVTMIRAVSMPRIPYKFPREKFLPEHLKRCENYDNLCPACRVFGWVDDKPLKGAKHTAYASRVRLSHGRLISSKGFLPDTPLAILSTPKPTTTSFYLLNQRGEPDPTVDYDTDGARLRGRKFYRHQDKAVPEEYTGKKPIDQNRTVHGALNPGAIFEFTLDFENLAPLELGALLYSLELEEGMFHRLGYAKPLGFGSTKITVDNIKTVEWSERLSSLDPNAGLSPVDKATLKEMFLEEMRSIYYEKFDNLLDDLRALLSTPPDLPIHYPRPTPSFKEDRPQFEWFVGNKKLRERGDGKTLSLPRDDTKGLPPINKYGKIG